MNASWTAAARATAHCLTGCAIGEVLGMVLGTAFSLPNPTTIALSIALAFVFGYALTARAVRHAGAPLRTALRVALAADTISIATMELVDNTVILAIPNALNATLSSPLFWLTLALSLAVAFLLTTPVNHWLLSRNRGHAVTHRYHHTAGHHSGG